MNLLKKLTKPTKDWTSVTFFGVSHSLTPAILTGSISTWPSDKTRPRDSTVRHSNEHFSIKDSGHHLWMVFNCSGIDQNVIHVNGHEALINELLENVIHHGLEGGW